jgi:D-xylose transport system substrate-binding protein
MYSKLQRTAVRCGVGVATVAMVMSSVGVVSAQDDSKYVAMLLPENVNPRWESQDAAFFVEKMKELSPDATVEVFNANNDTATQQRQAEQALTQGADVLVVVPIDGESAAVIADMGAEAGVPVLAYDRMIQSENTSFWVQASMFETGRAQAQHVVDNTKTGDTLVLLKGSPTDPNAGVIYSGQMDVLQPLFDSGERVLGYENWTQGWDPAIARQSMDQALTTLDNNVQGVVSSNDGNAAAAIASLEEQGLAGKVPVSGLDATVQALQLILLGQQTESVWRPFDVMAGVTAEVVTRLLNGEPVDDLISGTIENAVGAQVPFVPVDFYSAVGPEGVAYVIDHDPSIAKEDVCQGEAAATDFCKS